MRMLGGAGTVCMLASCVCRGMLDGAGTVNLHVS